MTGIIKWLERKLTSLTASEKPSAANTLFNEIVIVLNSSGKRIGVFKTRTSRENYEVRSYLLSVGVVGFFLRYHKCRISSNDETRMVKQVWATLIKNTNVIYPCTENIIFVTEVPDGVNGFKLEKFSLEVNVAVNKIISKE